MVATAIVAAIGNGAAFRKGRDFAAWLGIVPRQHSTGGKAKLLGISKRGNVYLRKVLIHGARAAELSEAFDDMARDHAGGLVVLSDALLNSKRRTIIGLAAQHRLAAMYEGREFVADGGLLSMGRIFPK